MLTKARKFADVLSNSDLDRSMILAAFKLAQQKPASLKGFSLKVSNKQSDTLGGHGIATIRIAGRAKFISE